MANAISMYEWVDGLKEVGADVSLEVRVETIFGNGEVHLIPVIRVNGVPLWEGPATLLESGGSLAFSGFVLAGDDLILEGFEELIHEPVGEDTLL